MTIFAFDFSARLWIKRVGRKQIDKNGKRTRRDEDPGCQEAICHE